MGDRENAILTQILDNMMEVKADLGSVKAGIHHIKSDLVAHKLEHEKLHTRISSVKEDCTEKHTPSVQKETKEVESKSYFHQTYEVTRKASVILVFLYGAYQFFSKVGLK